MKKRIVYLMSIILLFAAFAGCEKSTDADADVDTGNMGQYDDSAAVISEEEAMLLFEEIYEINKYLEDGYTMRFDGNTVEINYQTCICAVMEKDGVQEAYYAATWGSAYWYDPEGDAWIAVGFG